MKVFKAGRESSLLADMKAGTKTIEVRLARSKFLEYQPGDQVHIREDFYDGKKLTRSVPDQLTVEILKVEKYPSFRDLFESVGYEKVVPRAKSVSEALQQTGQFYSSDDQKKFGVLAIHFNVIDS